MSPFPLIRIRWSNEHWMAALFSVLVLYHLPRWMEAPGLFLNFLMVIAVSLLLDTGINFLKQQMVVCAVSAAVTGSIISLIAIDEALWVQLLGVACGLLLGKHLFGQIGKNIFNPAAVGLLVIAVVSQRLDLPQFQYSAYMLLCTVLSIPFMKFRRHVSLSVMVGMILGTLLYGNFSLTGIITRGVVFWACILYTDPVTVTDHPAYGVALGLVGGFFTALSGTLSQTLLIILLINLLSVAIRHQKWIMRKKPRSHVKEIKWSGDSGFIDLTGEKDSDWKVGYTPMREEILLRIKENGVFGMGGAGFSTFDKLTSVITSDAEEKVLIINGVECDPGLVHDSWLLKHRRTEIQKGIDLLRECLSFKKVILAARNFGGDFRLKGCSVHLIRNGYPCGEERKLISEVLKIELDARSHPSSRGILVLNIQTVLAIYHAAQLNEKIDTRYITVADLPNGIATVAKVRLGENIHEVAARVLKSREAVYAGGGIMKVHLAEPAETLDKKVSCIAVANPPRYKESLYCSQCGLCVEHCPMHLNVRQVVSLIDDGKMDEARAMVTTRCIGCGLCSYYCLAGRHLSGRMGLLNNEGLSSSS